MYILYRTVPPILIRDKAEANKIKKLASIDMYKYIIITIIIIFIKLCIIILTLIYGIIKPN